MKKWYDEEYEFEIEVTGFLRGDHMKQSSKPMRATRTQSTPFFPTTPDISAIAPKYMGKSTPRLRNM